MPLVIIKTRLSTRAICPKCNESNFILGPINDCSECYYDFLDINTIVDQSKKETRFNYHKKYIC